MKNLIEEREHLRAKLVLEGLSNLEMTRLAVINNKLNEAPIDYEGPERMEPGIERKITGKETPYHNFPAIPKMDRDFIELISSKRFKDSVDKVRRYMGNTQVIQGANPLMQLMMTVMQSMQQIIGIQMRHKEDLEQLAIKLVKEEMGIPEGAMQFKAELVMQPMGKAEGMQSEPELPSEEEVEEFMGDMETFNLERSKRRFINSLIQGAAFKGGHMYVLVSNELNDMDPRLLNLYGPPTVKAKAVTFPLLVHELVKGVYEIFGTHGLPDDPRQQEMVLNAEDTLPAEIWDSRLGPIFWEKFMATYPMELFDEDKKHIQHYLFMRFSALDAKEFFRVANLILAGDPKGNKFIQDMVDDIVRELKKEEYRQALPGEDDDYNNVDISDLDF